MKNISFILSIAFLLSFNVSHAQLSITNNNVSYTIDFETTLSGVNNGSFLGTGFTSNPTSGQLDTDAWATTGFSDGSKDFGVSSSSGDHARGSNNGGVSTGGIYSFDVGNGNRALAIQGTGGDWTPGTLTLKMTNNSGSAITEMNIDYKLYVRNDQNRSNSFNLSYSDNNSNYTGVSASNYNSPEGSTGTNWIIIPKNLSLTNLNIAPGGNFYIRWAGTDVGGSGSRDEFALEEIVITPVGASGGCSEPTAQASNLSFGTVTDNSIQASFTASAADKYLVIKSTSGSLGATPVDGTQYSAGSGFGSGTVLQYLNSTNINATGLSPNTTYYFYIFAANDICTGGPNYLNNNPLTSSTTTTGGGGGTGYYSGIGSQTCGNLKTALHNLINNHTTVSYASLWTHYQVTDDHDNDAGNEVIVWDMYSDNPSGAENEFTFVAEQCGTYQGEGDCYNREHSFPKSWWGGSTSTPQYTDIFTVVPADGWINGIRSNNPYGEVQSGTENHITNNGSKVGSSSISIPGYTGSVFEPIDDYKGDLARGYFYMATRYEDVISSWENTTTEADAVLDGTSFEVFEPWMITMLVGWHNSDPVDTKEIERNDAVFGIQGNRNPFIDHPEYVDLIWNCGGAPDTEAPSTPANLVAANTTETTTDLSWSASTDNVGVMGYDIYQDGAYLSSTTSTSYNATALTSGTSYNFYVEAYDLAGNISGSSNVVNITTEAPDTQAPSTPANLTASNTTETTTDLSWSASTDNVGVTGYDIYQDGAYLSSTTSTSYNVTALTSGTSYNFYVESYDAAGNISTSSNVVNVTTDSPPGNNEILGSYFETGWEGWSDGGNDCARYSGNNSPEGSYSIRIRDNSGTASAMTSPALDLTSYTSINIEFSFRANSMENNEDFWLRYYDGSSWQTIETYARGTDFNNNTFYTFNASIDASNYNFSSNSQIRFQCDASANNDKIYVDAVIVTGSANSNMISHPTEMSAELAVYTDGAEDINIEDIMIYDAFANVDAFNAIKLYPNPTSGLIYLELDGTSQEEIEMQIFDMMGKKIDQFKVPAFQQRAERNLSQLNDGIYILRYRNSPNEMKTEKIYLVR